MSKNPPFVMLETGALFSECELFRYRLWRIWDLLLPVLTWIMLNPSWADASENDNTVRKILEFSRRLGYGGINVVNLFAFRTPYPNELATAKYPVGPFNDRVLVENAIQSADTGIPMMCAWGAAARKLQRPRAVMQLLLPTGVQLQALRLLKDGSPEHPLYLPYTCQPVPFTFS